MLPLEIFLIKAVGWAQALLCIIASRKDLAALRSTQVTDSTTGWPRVLAVYRAAMFFWCLYIGLGQLAHKGTWVFAYFTVWNWWLLTLFFLLASLASARALWRGRRGDGRSGAADGLGRTVVVLFCIEAPTAVVVDAMTWLVLVPMLMASPDPEKRAHWQRMMYSWESYNQHGFNAVMVAGELLLGRLTLPLSCTGWLAAWASLYGLWSGVFFYHTKRFLYPFLDAHRPYAWVGYLGLYAGLTLSYLAVMGLARGRDMVVGRVHMQRKVKAA